VRLRIAIVGAASVSHGRRLVNDLFTYPWIDGATLVLMAPHLQHLTGIAGYARRIVRYNGLRTDVETTTDLRVALEGADVVFLLYDAGGFNAFDRDFRIAEKFGISLCIGDTMGPTGIMKGVRNIAALEDIARELQRSSSDSIVVSYVNPMAAMTMSADRLGIRTFIGVCGGVEATRKTIAACVQEPVDRLSTQFAGINHMSWAIEIRKDTKDLYPLLRQRMTLPEWIEAEPTRAEMLQHFGYFVTETSGHLSDFFPWFRRDPEVRRRYCSGPGYTGAAGAYHRFASYVHQRLRNADLFEYETGELESRSDDYGTYIADAWVSEKAYNCYGNVPNKAGLVDNLPSDAAVEVPVRIHGKRVVAEHVGPLPLQLAGLNNTNVLVQQVLVEAALKKSPQLLLAAVSMDPLTAATIDLPACRRLTEELIAANSAWFPSVDLAFTFPDVSVYSGHKAAGKRLESEDVLEPVRRFDRQRRKRRGLREGKPNLE
jgi:alpha-galactosidase